MKKPRIVTCGNRREWDPKLWGTRDFEDELLDQQRIAKPLTHSPGGNPPDLAFTLFPERTVGGARSKAIDELLDRHLSGRRRR